MQDFIEDYFPRLGEFLYGKTTEFIYLANAADYDMASGIRQSVMREDKTPIRIVVSNTVSFDGKEESLPAGKIIIMDVRTSGLIQGPRMERSTVTFRRECERT